MTPPRMYHRRIASISFVLLAFTAAASSQPTCPRGCVCVLGFVSCSGLTSFPLRLPSATTSLSLSGMAIPEIPAGVLSKLHGLKRIEIDDSRIGKIKGGAFLGITDVECVHIYDSTIGIIESEAFSEMSRVTAMLFHNLRVKTVKKFAFRDIGRVNEFSLFYSNITEMESSSFYNMSHVMYMSVYSNRFQFLRAHAFQALTSVKTFDVYLNEMSVVECKAFDVKVGDVHHFGFYTNELRCSCDLMWISDMGRIQGMYNPFKDQLFRNWCTFKTKKIFLDDMRAKMSACSDESHRCFREELLNSSWLDLKVVTFRERSNGRSSLKTPDNRASDGSADHVTARNSWFLVGLLSAAMSIY